MIELGFVLHGLVHLASCHKPLGSAGFLTIPLIGSLNEHIMLLANQSRFGTVVFLNTFQESHYSYNACEWLKYDKNEHFDQSASNSLGIKGKFICTFIECSVLDIQTGSLQNSSLQCIIVFEQTFNQ